MVFNKIGVNDIDWLMVARESDKRLTVYSNKENVSITVMVVGCGVLGAKPSFMVRSTTSAPLSFHLQLTHPLKRRLLKMYEEAFGSEV